MANNVEATVKVKVEADTSQAQKEVNELSDSMKAFMDFTKTAAETSGKSFISEADMKKLDVLQDKLFNLLETEKISETELGQILAGIGQVQDTFGNVIGNKLREQNELFNQLYGQVNQFRQQSADLLPTARWDNEGLNKIAEARQLYDDINKKLLELNESGKISEETFKQLSTELKGIYSEYGNTLLKNNTTASDLNSWQNFDSSSLFRNKTNPEELKEVEKEHEKILANMQEISKEYDKWYESQQKINQETTQDRINREIQDGKIKLGVDINDIKPFDEEEIKNTNVNYEQLVTTLMKLTNTSSTTSSSVLALAKSFGASTAAISPFLIGIGAVTTYLSATIKAFKAGKKELDEMLSVFDNISKTLGKGSINFLGDFVNGLSKISDIATETIQKLDELSESGIELERTFLTTSAYIGKDATDSLYEFMGNISAASNTMMMSVNDVVAAAGSMGLASEDLVTATENMTVMGRNMGVLIGDTEKAFKDLGQVISKGYVGRDNLLYRIFTKEEINTVRQLSDEVARYNFVMERANRVQDLYNEYIQTASGKVTLMKMQYQEFMTNIGTVALQLYAIVAPVLTKILTLANEVLSAIINIFGWAPKAVGFESVSDKIAGSMGKVGGAAKKATKQVASFDDVIQINDNKSGGGGAGGFDTEGLKDFSSILDDVLGNTDDLTDKWAKFKELLTAGDFKGAGSEFARVIGNELWSINWNDIQTKAKDASSAISSFINGLVDISDSGVRDAWEGIGYTIAEVLNTIIGVVGTFLSDTNFNDIGKALGIAWQAMWASLNVEEAGQALYNGIMGVFDFVGGFLESGGLKQIALAAKKFIQSFFGSFDNIDIAIMTKTATDLVDDIIDSIGIVAEALTSDDVKRVVFGLIEHLVMAFKEKGPEWGSKLNVIISDILGFIEKALKTADNAGLLDAIKQFLEHLKLGELLTQYMKNKLELLKVKLILEVGKFSAVGTALANVIADAFASIKEKIRRIFDDLSKQQWFNTLVRILTSGGGAAQLSTGFLSNIRIPKLATGGVVTSSTLANIGEAGPEAVLPLSNNTQWMDALATKIASQMGTTKAGGTIRVELPNKPFYTKSEMIELGGIIQEALNMYGRNVSIV